MPSSNLIALPAVQSLRKTITFTGGAGAGLNASPIPFFNITKGVQIVGIWGLVTTNLTVSNVLATISLGVTGSTALFIPLTVANTLLTSAPVWGSTTATAGGLLLPSVTQNTAVGANIIGTVGGTGDVTGGVLDIYCTFYAANGASLVVA